MSGGGLEALVSTELPRWTPLLLTGRVARGFAKATYEVLCLFQKISSVPRVIDHRVSV